MSPEKISQGPTFKGFISTFGLILLVLGIIVAIFGIFVDVTLAPAAIGLTFMFVGTILLLSIRGVLIDHDQKRIKPYFDIFFAKIGSWEPLENYNSIILKYLNESQTMNSRAGSVTFRTKTFEIFLASDNKPKLLIKELVGYDEAKAFLNEYSIKLGKLKIDGYEQMKDQLQKRRQNMRR